MIDLLRENITRTYDTILCIDVIEHVPNARHVVNDLVAHLRRGGKIVITALAINPDSNVHPMHEQVNFDREYLHSIGLTSTDQPWLFIKK
jgi:2-polyprenyl-3-methyl-5-hydroxy-6-metoxy-1,4-benzoquinol methylase